MLYASVVRREKDVKFVITPVAIVLEAHLGAVLICFVIDCQGNITQSKV